MTEHEIDRAAFDPAAGFSRIGGGSLGGKARGLGFVNYLLTEHQVRERFREVQISVPPSVVLGTDVFDEFLERNDLRDLTSNVTDEQEIGRRFIHLLRCNSRADKLADTIENVARSAAGLPHLFDFSRAFDRNHAGAFLSSIRRETSAKTASRSRLPSIRCKIDIF